MFAESNISFSQRDTEGHLFAEISGHRHLVTDIGVKKAFDLNNSYVIMRISYFDHQMKARIHLCLILS